MGLKQKVKKKDAKRLAEIHEMPCCVCKKWGEKQYTPTQAHHCIHDRYSFAKRPDSDTIPLCEGHHQGLFDASKIAIHREPERWRQAYGADWSYLNSSKPF